jgi:tetratricopeptide (TPR) repeat protein
VAFAIVLGVLVAAPAALAQPTPEGKAIAESLFRDGRTLMDEGRYPEACRKLEESQRLDPALGTLLNMAVCHEKEGKIATAWAEFNEAMVLARREGRQDRYDYAMERVGAIEPDLPKLAIAVSLDARVQGLEILRNGTPIGSGAWGASLPVDPGEVVIEARAPKFKPWTTTLQIALKEKKSVEVPSLEPAPEPEPVPITGPVQPPPKQPPPPPEEFWNTSRIAGVTLAGVGVVTMAVGGVFGYSALSQQSDSDAYCSGSTCFDQRGVELSKDATRNANIANITIGAGALVGAVGALLILTGGSDAPPTEVQSGVDVSFTMAPSQTSAGVRGTW